MLEFYTKEFKERAKNQINEVNNIIKEVLPNIQKWQMKGCFVIGSNFEATYVPLVDNMKNQVGTEVKIKKDNEKYVITSGKEIIRFNYEINNDIVETYFVKLDNNVLSTSIMFYDGDDFISVSIEEVNGIENIKVSTNLDSNMYKDALLGRGDSNILEYVKSIYYSSKGKQRIRE